MNCNSASLSSRIELVQCTNSTRLFNSIATSLDNQGELQLQWNYKVTNELNKIAKVEFNSGRLFNRITIPTPIPLDYPAELGQFNSIQQKYYFWKLIENQVILFNLFIVYVIYFIKENR